MSAGTIQVLSNYHIPKMDLWKYSALFFEGFATWCDGFVSAWIDFALHHRMVVWKAKITTRFGRILNGMDQQQLNRECHSVEMLAFNLSVSRVHLPPAHTRTTKTIGKKSKRANERTQEEKQINQFIRFPFEEDCDISNYGSELKSQPNAAG